MPKRRRSKSVAKPEDPSTTTTTSSSTTLSPPTWPMTSNKEGYMVFFGRGVKEGEWKPERIWYITSEGAQRLSGSWAKGREWPHPSSGVAWWINLLSMTPDKEEDNSDSLPLDVDVKLLKTEDSARLVKSEESEASSRKKRAV